MKKYFILLLVFVFVISCSKDKGSVIPIKSNSNDYPVENHFPAGSGNQLFPDIPITRDPTKSNKYRIKVLYYYSNPYKVSPFRYTTFEYDNEGKIIKETYIDSSVTPGSYDTYEYRDGRLYKKSIFISDMLGVRLAEYYIFSYQNDKLIREDYYDKYDFKVYSWNYIYARNRLVVKYKEGGEGDKYKYYYDEKGSLIKEESYNRENISYIRNQTYDTHDRIITQQGYIAGKVLDYSAEFKYNSTNKKPVEEVYYDKDNTVVNKIYWSYTEQDFPLYKRHEDASGLNPLEENTYHNGVIIEKRTYNKQFGFSEGVMTKYEYEKI